MFISYHHIVILNVCLLCLVTDTPAVNQPLPGELLRPVAATVIAVLVLLLFAVAVAFCRPKFQDIKRRWREQKENDVNIIVNNALLIIIFKYKRYKL